MATEQEKRPDQSTVWLARDILKTAKAIAGLEDSSIGAVIESELRKQLPKRLAKAMDKKTADLGGESGEG